MSRELKPPLGLRPRWIVDVHRQAEIVAACERYLEAGKPLPIEWLEELNEIATRELRRHQINADEAWRENASLQAKLQDWTADEDEARRKKERTKVCEASITYDHNEDARIAALAKCDHYHRFDSGSGHCEGCGMHRSEYNPSVRDACAGFPTDGKSSSARQQLLLWARYHLHSFGETKCINCGLLIDEYDKSQWTTLVPCPASLPE